MDCLNQSLPGRDHLLGTLTQRSTQDALDRVRLSQLLANSNLRDLARLNTLSRGYSTSAWLQDTPQPSLGLVRSEFTMALRYWLGIPLFGISPPQACARCTSLDQHGDHLLGCGQGPLRIRRHDTLCNISERSYRESYIILNHALSQGNSRDRTTHLGREQRSPREYLSLSSSSILL